jgi:transposase
MSLCAGSSRSQATVRAFFDALGPERAARLAEVSADGAEWIHDVIRERAPQARICLDSYHAVAWANKALEKLRRRMAAELRATGEAELAGTRRAVIKKPEDLTSSQKTTIAALARINSPLYRGYLMKEQLREIFKAGPGRGHALLAGLISWCARCRIPEFARLGATLRRFRDLIWNTLEAGTTRSAGRTNDRG